MRFQDQVVLITGGARGQGRTHAVEFAREGADVVVLDLCADLGTRYPSTTTEDLDETQRLVEQTGRRCLAFVGDVRDADRLHEVVGAAMAAFGRLDILVANAGILHNARIDRLDPADFDRVVATNLGGVFRSIHAVAPVMIEQGRGRIVAISSMAGRRAYGRAAHYASSKWGVIGLVKDAAIDLAPHGITVNAVCPTNVDTPMAVNDDVAQAFNPELEHPSREDLAAKMSRMHPLRVPWVECADVSRTVMHLASDDARYVTGDVLTVSAGLMTQNSG